MTDFNFKIQDNNNAKKLQLAFNLKKVRFEHDYNFETKESIFSFKDAKACDKAKWYAEILIDKTKEPNWNLTK